MTNSFIITEVDPTYSTQFPIAVFDNEDEAIHARQWATKRMTEEAADRGVYYKITEFKTNKLYH